MLWWTPMTSREVTMATPIKQRRVRGRTVLVLRGPPAGEAVQHRRTPLCALPGARPVTGQPLRGACLISPGPLSRLVPLLAAGGDGHHTERPRKAHRRPPTRGCARWRAGVSGRGAEGRV